MALSDGRAGTIPRAAAVDTIAARPGITKTDWFRPHATILRPERIDLATAAVEFLLTTAFMFAVFGLVRWGINTAAADAGPTETRLRVATVSMAVGLVIVAFIVSRPGRFTGAHMNPAITLASFVAGRTPARRVLPYLAAQSAGSVTAMALSQAAWGAAASSAVVQPATGRSGSVVALAETMVLAIIVAVMCRATTRFLPWIMGGMFGLQGVILGTVTGGSANPARQLGPALLAGEHHLLAVYLIAPIVGAVIAARATRKTDTDGLRPVEIHQTTRVLVTGTGARSLSANPLDVPLVQIRDARARPCRCEYAAMFY